MEDWLDTKCDSRVAVSASQEVGEACDDADVDVGPDLVKGPLEDPDVTASQHLSTLKT